MHDEVDGHPVADGVVGLQQHKAHAHVVVGPHLQEPVDPVKGALAEGAESGAHGRLHGRLGGDAQRDGEEGEVVARVKAVPVGADQHGPAGPEEGKQEVMKQLHLSFYSDEFGKDAEVGSSRLKIANIYILKGNKER